MIGTEYSVLAAREIGNGIWTVVAIEMLMFFALYVFGRLWGVAFGRQLVFFAATRAEEHPWWLPNWFDQPMQWGSAFMMFAMGTTIRGLWAWEFSHCVRLKVPCEWLRSDLAAGLLWFAVAIAVIGALCFIRLIAPPQWRVLAVSGSALVAVAVPVLRFAAA